MNEIAKVIRYNRLKQGLSQVELGIKIGVSGQMISNIERGLGFSRKRANDFRDALKMSQKKWNQVVRRYNEERIRKFLGD